MRHLCYLSLDHGVDVGGTKGASVHLRSICKALVQVGHRVTLVASRCDGDAEALEASIGCAIEVIPGARDFAKLRRSLRDLYGKGLRLPPELRQEVTNRESHGILRERWESDRPDAVIERLSLMGIAGVRVAGEMGIPHLMEVNAVLSEEASRHRALWDIETAQAIERETLERTAHIFAVSAALEERLVGSGVPARKIECLPNAFDDLLFQPQDGQKVREELCLGDRFTVGLAGSMRGWHGVRTLLRTCALLDPETCAVLLIGAGEESGWVDDFRHGNPGLQVVTTGAVDHEQVPALLSACDVLVAPYEAHDEFYFSPLKVYEYMAMAKPVVASRQGQIAELIRDGETGLLFEPGDSSGLRAALERLRDDSTLRRRLGEAAHRAVGAHTWRANAERVSGAVEKAIA